jgi:hypothetical protein
LLQKLAAVALSAQVAVKRLRLIQIDGGQNKLILGASRATESKPTEPHTLADEWPQRLP